jgi:NAD(P)H-hydrate epimerase
MTIRPLSRDEVRFIDVQAAQELDMPTVILMENAGRGAAAWIRDQGVPARAKVLILCGPGNNGGDGGVVARHLDLWGYRVQVVWFARANHLKGDAAVQFQILDRAGFDQTCWDDEPSIIPGRLDALLGGTDWVVDALLGCLDDAPSIIDHLARLDMLLGGADWIVDALLGTGLTRPVEGILRAVIMAMNRSGKPILALDLPSGLDADTGQPLGVAVRAQATVTFVAPKLGFAVAGADTYTGKVTVVDIGVPRAILEAYQVNQ